MDHHAIHVKCIPEAMGIGGAGELYGEADIAIKEFPKASAIANLSEESFAVVWGIREEVCLRGISGGGKRTGELCEPTSSLYMHFLPEKKTK